MVPKMKTTASFGSLIDCLAKACGFKNSTNQQASIKNFGT
jgi:hypothetical protein